VTLLYWFFAIAFFALGAFALARPDVILAIRARFRRVQDDQPAPGRFRRKAFGPREVRVCGVALVFIAVVLARSLAVA
jgi:hypothetical protein